MLHCDSRHVVIAAMPTPSILYEDSDVLAISKPAGLLVHPSPRQKRGTLIDWIDRQHPSLQTVGERPHRHGLVHRLDRPVSGVMVLAKHQDAYRQLKEQFADGAVEKHYSALVYGTPDDESGTIEKRIAGNKGRRKTIRDDSRQELLDQSQYALTHWSVQKRLPDYTLLDVQPVTGRTHQIRVHLASIGHHVVCDQIYAERKPCPGLKRPFLHAAAITVKTSEGRCTVEAPLPDELAYTLESLRSTH
jgi:23S rRNA pseudouridine1911/1915/1917 synthase